MAAALAIAASACGGLGYTDRVLVRQPSPDGQLIAVCQEVPVFDGPNYDVRLERPDGTRVRELYRIGDGDPCSEIAWSPDGRMLGVLTGLPARIMFVDVSRSREHQSFSTRQVDLWSRVLSREQERAPLLARGRELRFVEPLTVEVHLCTYRLPARSGGFIGRAVLAALRGAPDPRVNDDRPCFDREAVHRFAARLPVTTRHRAE
jgi:hypothetical protein